jgi:hypothetical protein
MRHAIGIEVRLADLRRRVAERAAYDAALDEQPAPARKSAGPLTWRGKRLADLTQDQASEAIAALAAYRPADPIIRRRFLTALRGA